MYVHNKVVDPIESLDPSDPSIHRPIIHNSDLECYRANSIDPLLHTTPNTQISCIRYVGSEPRPDTTSMLSMYLGLSEVEVHD